MLQQSQDKSWMISILILCLVVWLWVSGCGGTIAQEQVSPKAQVTHEVESRRGLGSPEFDTIHMPKPWETCADLGVAYGYIDEAKTTWVWGFVHKGKAVWPLMVQVDADKNFVAAWVDKDYDGEYDERIESKEEFLAGYPNPCVVFLGRHLEHY